jgi:hypothetical protein
VADGNKTQFTGGNITMGHAYGYEDYDIYDKDGYNKYGFDKDGYDRHGNYIANMFGNEPDEEWVPEEDTITTPKKTITLPKFTASDATKSAQDKVNGIQNAVDSKGKYSYANQAHLDSLINKILNRPAFSYDFNSDAIYQQYRDKYIKQGQMAMADTMGQAAAMTGGYGNSYATSAGYQAYQASLENLNDIIPELYAMALERYNMEGQVLKDQYAALADDRNADYGMWADDYNRLLSQLEYYTGVADTSWDRDYDAYRDEVADAKWQAGYDYTAERDAVADAKWQKEYDRLFANDANASTPKEPEKEPEDEYEQKTWNDHNEEEYENNVKENGGSYYEPILSGVKTMKSQGKSWSEVMSYLDDAVGNSYISRDEYATLFQEARKLWYPDRGSGVSGGTTR